MKKRYAIVDIHSGYIWGVADAETPCDACRFIDENDALEYGRTYREISRADVTDSGYIVYEAPPGWDCDDGEDEAAIDEVSAMPRVAYVSGSRNA